MEEKIFFVCAEVSSLSTFYFFFQGIFCVELKVQRQSFVPLKDGENCVKHILCKSAVFAVLFLLFSPEYKKILLRKLSLP